MNAWQSLAWQSYRNAQHLSELKDHVPVSLESQIIKLAEEGGEVAKAYIKSGSKDRLLDEVADVVLVALSIAGYYDDDLGARMMATMQRAHDEFGIPIDSHATALLASLQVEEQTE